MAENNRAYKLLLVTLLTLCANCFAEPMAIDLQGTWQIEGKDSFERWEKQSSNSLVGESYKQVDGKKVVSETLLLRINPDKTLYEATVPDQNEGQTVVFTLNTDIKNALSFENPDHDFPTKIIYAFETPDRLFVDVQGRDAKGFSYYMVRVD